MKIIFQRKGAKVQSRKDGKICFSCAIKKGGLP
jgi:hypothetical protein